jgi:hypothetical protein
VQRKIVGVAIFSLWFHTFTHMTRVTWLRTWPYPKQPSLHRRNPIRGMV